MFSFHKPKVYRSTTGCCICKAKSSSSRFTDSKKYEEDFIRCFNLEEQRTGEICNACVLLVKRWKKLPSGTPRNWHHVVDARAGPGTRSMVRSRCRRNKAQDPEACPKVKENQYKKHKYIPKPRMFTREQSPLILSDDGSQGVLGESDQFSEGSVSMPGSLNASPTHQMSPYLSDDFDYSLEHLQVTVPEDCSNSPSLPMCSNKRKQSYPIKKPFSSLIDLSYWNPEEVCCGTVFHGRLGELLIQKELFKPCCEKASFSPPSPSLSPASSPVSLVIDSPMSNLSFITEEDEPGIGDYSNENAQDLSTYRETPHHLANYSQERDERYASYNHQGRVAENFRYAHDTLRYRPDRSTPSQREYIQHPVYPEDIVHDLSGYRRDMCSQLLYQNGNISSSSSTLYQNSDISSSSSSTSTGTTVCSTRHLREEHPQSLVSYDQPPMVPLTSLVSYDQPPLVPLTHHPQYQAASTCIMI